MVFWQKWWLPSLFNSERCRSKNIIAVPLCTREREKHRMAFGTMPIHNCRWGRPYVLFSFVWNRCLCTAGIDWWWMPFSRADVPITLINWRFRRAWERSYAFQEQKILRTRFTFGLVVLLLKAFDEFAYDGLFLYRPRLLPFPGSFWRLGSNLVNVLDSKALFFQGLPTCYWNSDQRTHVVKHCC